MAKSYYKVINEEKYDRSLLELAEKLVAQKKQGRLSEKDAKTLFTEAGDGRGFTDIEVKTLTYIMQHFTLSKTAKEFFEKQLKAVSQSAKEKPKPKPKKKEETKPKKKETKSREEKKESKSQELITSKEENRKPQKEKNGLPWWLIVLLLVLLFFLLLFFWRSCSSPEISDNEPSSVEMQELEAIANEETELENTEETSPPKESVNGSVDSQEKISQENTTSDLQQLKELASATVVRFNKNETNISQNSNVQGIAELLKKNPKVKLQILGHTCKLGNEATNKRVSKRRANSVLNLLLRDGVDSSQIDAIGKANDEPLNNGDSESELAQNRRVTFQVIE